MTRTYDELLRAITEDPDDDDTRRAFADYLRPHDPDRARFIELQLEAAHRRRDRREGRVLVVGTEEMALLRRHEHEWSHTIAKYAVAWEFDRGFITSVTMEPHVFLERAEWLYINAPIRHITLTRAHDGAFPMSEIAGSHLLSHLDSIDLINIGLSDANVAQLAASQSLNRLLSVNLSLNKLGEASYEALAASPSTRKLLSVVRSGASPGAQFPGQRFEDTGTDDSWGAPLMDWTDLSQEGKALERKYGYIPWLHAANGCTVFDAAWYVAQGILPLKPVGTPVDQDLNDLS